VHPLSPIAALGRSTRRAGAGALGFTRFTGALIRASADYPGTARTVLWRSFRNQILFTAVQALPFIAAIAGIIGITVIIQARAQGLQGSSDVLGQVMASVVVRELGPLLTAVVVISRSGTAIAAEMATNLVLGETDALEALGVDPLQYLVAPRVAGGAISVAILVVFFNAITLVSAGLTAFFTNGVSLESYTESLRLALTVRDLGLVPLKGFVFGAGIAALCAYAGLSGERRPTAIPQSVTRGVMLALLFVFVTSGLFSLAAYL